jgi:adenosine deaminase
MTYDGVHIALHAGELVPGLAPLEALTFHIRDSTEVGHVERIGHGVDVMDEERPADLMREMARRRVLVEICLSSNNAVLGVRDLGHPLRQYQRYGMPVALATDDAGVLRSSITGECLKGVREQQLNYRHLKTMARASLEHAFLTGAGL